MSEFKVGDLVVFIDEDSVTGIYEVETVSPKLGNPRTIKIGHIGRVRVSKYSVRHATKEEIKAGRRLP